MEAKGKKKNHYKKRLSEVQEIRKTKTNKSNNKGTLQESYNNGQRMYRRFNKASREHCKKKSKVTHTGTTEDKEESQNNNKKYNRHLQKKIFLKTDLNY